MSPSTPAANQTVDPAAGPILHTYAHDFETTIQKYVRSPTQLLGVLNFSAFWNDVVYLNDIAVGDNAYLIESAINYLLRSPDTEQHRLYISVAEFVRAGILRCHIRKRIVIKGEVLHEETTHPLITQVFEGWYSAGGQDVFTCQLFGTARAHYNAAIDNLLGDKSSTVKRVERYDPDLVKPEFRRHIRAMLDNDSSELRKLVDGLPQELASEYRRVCDANKFFTNVDLWKIIRNVPEAKELIIAHGHINQQCCADQAHAGTTGQNLSALDVPALNWNLHVGETHELRARPIDMLDDLFERAEVVMEAPSLSLLALLTPEQIIQLRESAQNTVFALARRALQDPEIALLRDAFSNQHTIMKYTALDSFVREYIGALANYWRYICDFLERTYPMQARPKGRLAIFSHGNLPAISPALKKEVVSTLLGHLIVKLCTGSELRQPT